MPRESSKLCTNLRVDLSSDKEYKGLNVWVIYCLHG